MALKYSLNLDNEAKEIDNVVQKVLNVKKMVLELEI